MLSTADILRRAREHISDPAMWHKGSYFKDEVYPHYPSPVDDDLPCCATGAVWWATGDHPLNSAAVRYLNSATPGEGGLHVWHYNDAEDTTHADILAVFDRAIELAEADA